MLVRRLSLAVLNICVIGFALTAALIGVNAAYDPSLSQHTLIAIFISAGIYFALAYGLRTEGMARIAAAALVIAGVALALYFITQFDYQNYPETPALIQRIGKITTLLPNLGLAYIHPNGAATFLEVLLPLAVALIITVRSRFGKIAWAIVSLVLLYAIFLTVSRGSWISLIVVAGLALALLIALRLPRTAAAIVIGLFIVVLIGGTAFLLTGGISRLPFLTSTAATAESRLTLYRNSLYLVRDYLFTGVGLGDTFGLVYSRYGLLIQVPFLTYSHNLPLAVWLGQGVFGLIALIGIVLALYFIVYHTLRSTRPSALFYGAWLGVTATLLHGLTDARQYTESPWIMPALFAGIGLTVALGRLALRDSETQTQTESSPSSVRRAVPLMIGIVVVAGIALALVALQNQMRVAWYTNAGAVAETRAALAPDLTPAERQKLQDDAAGLYQDALTLDPQYSPANRRLGNWYVGQEQYEQAVPLLETAATAEPDNPAAIKGLGLAYVWVGKLEDALAQFKHLDDVKAMADELYTWGTYRREQKQPLLTARAWETAEMLGGGSKNVNVLLGIADDYRTAGNTESARRWYQHALELDPQNQAAKDGLAALN